MYSDKIEILGIKTDYPGGEGNLSWWHHESYKSFECHIEKVKSKYCENDEVKLLISINDKNSWISPKDLISLLRNIKIKEILND